MQPFKKDKLENLIIFQAIDWPFMGSCIIGQSQA